MLELILNMDEDLFPGTRYLSFIHKKAKLVPGFKALLGEIMGFLEGSMADHIVKPFCHLER